MKILCPLKGILTHLWHNETVEGFQQCFINGVNDENITQTIKKDSRSLY